MGEKLVAAGELDADEEFSLVERAIMPAGGGLITLTLEDEELDVLNRVLRKFALRTRPPAWQAASIPHNGATTPWILANLVPIYPDKPFSASDKDHPLMKESMKVLAGPPRVPGDAQLQQLAGSRPAKPCDAPSKPERPAMAAVQRGGSSGAARQTPAKSEDQTPAQQRPHARDPPGDIRGMGSAAELHTCAACGGSPSERLRCGRCKGVWYCNRGCQKAHWKHHKPTCGHG